MERIVLLVNIGTTKYQDSLLDSLLSRDKFQGLKGFRVQGVQDLGFFVIRILSVGGFQRGLLGLEGQRIFGLNPKPHLMDSLMSVCVCVVIEPGSS